MTLGDRADPAASDQTGSSPLVRRVAALIEATQSAYRDEAPLRLLEVAAERLHEPLRVAIAGRVKTGKSTLLNALVGDELAPTDEGECTRVVTWYQHGLVYRVMATPKGGQPEQVRFARESGAIEVDLGNRTADDLERLTVDWPARTLKAATYIDTPGMDSISTDISAKSFSFLTEDEEMSTPSDAVVFLLRHLHTSDVGFLEAFHHEDQFQPTPVNCLAVLSRADEVAVGRLDALESAAKIAARYSTEPRLRALVQRVVPVAGLLAQAAVNLRELEFRRLRELALSDAAAVDRLLLSVDRFVADTAAVNLTPTERRLLLDRFGMFGVRYSVHLIRGGDIRGAADLARHLVRVSGIIELREALTTQFTLRKDTLKARSAMQTVAHVLENHPNSKSRELRARLEEIRSGAHEFRELQLLNQIRRSEITLASGDMAEVERLLGCDGGEPIARLGLPVEADEEDVRRALSDTLERWRRRAESPVSTRQISDAARVIVRTCEGMYVQLATTTTR